MRNTGICGLLAGIGYDQHRLFALGDGGDELAEKAHEIALACG
jgi:hypothetical protein